MTGIMFIINTDPLMSGNCFHLLLIELHSSFSILDLQSHLQYIYSQIFIEMILHNPLHAYDPDAPITNTLFISRLEEYLKTIPNAK